MNNKKKQLLSEMRSMTSGDLFRVSITIEEVIEDCSGVKQSNVRNIESSAVVTSTSMSDYLDSLKNACKCIFAANLQRTNLKLVRRKPSANPMWEYKISAIKMLRELTGKGLVIAKSIIEHPSGNLLICPNKHLAEIVCKKFNMSENAPDSSSKFESIDLVDSMQNTNATILKINPHKTINLPALTERAAKILSEENNCFDDLISDMTFSSTW